MAPPSTPPKLKGIVFDLDGTLVDSLKVTFDAFNLGITHFGGRPHTGEEIMGHFGPGEGQILARIVGPENAEVATRMARAHLEANLAQVPLHEGVAELLERLKSSGVEISIVTGRSWDATERILNHHDLLDRFVTVIAHDHVESSKPSPEGILLALGRMRLKPLDCCYVGDSPMDMKAASQAGMPGVAALWDPMSKRQDLLNAGAQIFAQHPMDVWQYWISARR